MTVRRGNRFVQDEHRQIREARRRLTSAAAVVWLALGSLVLVPEVGAESGEAVVLGAGSSDTTPTAEQGSDRILRYFSREALADLAAPIALYPDDLLAIVLQASTQPEQIVAAATLLEQQQNAPGPAPSEAWDPAVIALLNYPEVLAKLRDDLSWTEDLGMAVRNQEPELLRAVSAFRESAYTAGNLRSDYRLRVDRQHGAIAIRPAHPQVLYVPYYDVSRVVVRQAEPAYHFYPRPYPVYYYPYAAGFPFAFDDFWGVRSRYHIGWRERHVFLSRSPVETLRYHAGTPSQQPRAPRSPARPAYGAPGPRGRAAAGSLRHPGRELAANPRHPGRDLVLYPRHPGRSDVSERHHGGRFDFHEQRRRAPAAAASAPESGGQPAAGRRHHETVPYGRAPYGGTAAPQHPGTDGSASSALHGRLLDSR